MKISNRPEHVVGMFYKNTIVNIYCGQHVFSEIQVNMYALYLTVINNILHYNSSAYQQWSKEMQILLIYCVSWGIVPLSAMIFCTLELLLPTS